MTRLNGTINRFRGVPTHSGRVACAVSTHTVAYWFTHSPDVIPPTFGNGTLLGFIGAVQTILLKPNPKIVNDDIQGYLDILASMYAHGCFVNATINVGRSMVKLSSNYEALAYCAIALISPQIMALIKSDDLSSRYVVCMLVYTAISLSLALLFDTIGGYVVLAELMIIGASLFTRHIAATRKLAFYGGLSALYKMILLVRGASGDTNYQGSITTAGIIMCSIVSAKIAQYLQNPEQPTDQSTIDAITAAERVQDTASVTISRELTVIVPSS